MELKTYQNNVMDDLSIYLRHVVCDKNLNAAWNGYWAEKNIPVGFMGVPSYNNTIAGVPHVCMKVPTGGGKTFMAAAALRKIFDEMPLSKDRLVIWLVPSDSILTQTINNFTNPEHSYYLRLEKDFAGRVNIYTKEQLLNAQDFSPDTIHNALSVCILSYASLRINARSAESRKVYQENGNLIRFSQYLNEKELFLTDTPETSLIQVIRSLSPVVIVDESHNAESELSIEMIERLNPSFVLDLTATPKENSNIIAYVDARELKKENMVKLPVIVYNRKSTLDVLRDGILLRNALEAEAKEERNDDGRSIRPIMLLQAQPNRNEESETYIKIKNKLLSLGIPKEQIAIKTSDVDEIGKQDLMSADCSIRYIITVNALKEGWDCPYAYILASVANRSSEIEVEQILGRVLRQPYAKKCNSQLLNNSYVITSSANFNGALNSIVTGLNQAGFSKKDYRLAAAKDIEQVQEKTDQIGINDGIDEITDEEIETVKIEIENASNNPKITTMVKEMMSTAQEKSNEYEEKIKSFEGVDVVSGELAMMLNKGQVQQEFAEEIKELRIPQFYVESEPNLFSAINYTLLEKENLNDGLNLSTQDANINFEFSAAEIAKVDIEESGVNDSTPKIRYLNRTDSEYLTQIVAKLPESERLKKCSEAIASQINRNNRYSTKEIIDYVERVIAGMSEDDISSMETNLPLYASKIRTKIQKIEESHREKNFLKWIETGKIMTKEMYALPKYITPMYATDTISKSLYTLELDDMNDFEKSVLHKIVSFNNIRWWHRIIEKGENEFKINGYINHYPDFIVMTEKGNVLLIETKGDDRDNSDSKRKLAMGREWQSQAANKYKYFMVYNNNATGWEGSYTLDEFAEILSYL